jgi:predicted O-methyltransferase YrrM
MERHLPAIHAPADLHRVLDDAWRAASKVPGFLLESEARFLGMAAACTPGQGGIVEIGSFKGKSTVMLAKVSQHYGLGPITAIDPHNFNNEELHEYRTTAGSSSYDEFLRSIKSAGVAHLVDVRRAFSTDVAKQWNQPIRFLWIDGDHSYAGAKSDFDGFLPSVAPGGTIALHDALHEFEGPIRVFVDDMLRSDRFGPAGFVGSIAWSQFRPSDGSRFRSQRRLLEHRAAPLLPFLQGSSPLRGARKLVYKLRRSRVPRSPMSPGAWAALINQASL